MGKRSSQFDPSCQQAERSWHTALRSQVSALKIGIIINYSRGLGPEKNIIESQKLTKYMI